MANTFDNDVTVTTLGGLPYVKGALNLPEDFPKSDSLPQSPLKSAPRRPVKKAAKAKDSSED